MNVILAILAGLSLALTVWQWVVARRFPLHQRVSAHSFPPAVTLLKPLKGSDQETERCLRSWFEQDYTGRVQILFGVASADDPVCSIVRKLQQEFSGADAQLVICGPLLGANAKVSKLVELERLAKHDILVISDADVCVPADLLSNVVEVLRGDEQSASQVGEKSALKEKRQGTGALQNAGAREAGLVNCFYALANPTTLAMRWEAIAINADFWSQVLQAQSLKPIDFALGAVMVTRRKQVEEIGGFRALVDCLADDYQLGHRIAGRGYGIALCPVVVECWSASMGWGAVWKHQLRWARTIRVCQPVPYFFSILSNATLWPLLWLVANPRGPILAAVAGCCLARIVSALDLQRKLTQSRRHLVYWWMVPIKDLLQTLIWLLAFAGNTIEWRGERMRLRRDGTLEKRKAESGAIPT